MTLQQTASSRQSPPFILISGSMERRGIEFGDASLSLSLNYPCAIQAAGGLPWLLPSVPDRDFVAESVRRSDGVMLTGGDDVQPELYRQGLSLRLRKTVHPAAPERDLFELMLINEVFRQRKPLLAICRGQQILNVALGGTLLVDIASEMPGALNHARAGRKNCVVHEVDIHVGSLLAEATGCLRLGVNSSHHQAVARIAKPLRMSAVSDDGVIEAVELEPGSRQLLPYLLAVQFHPERMFSRHAEHLELFRSFIRACLRNRRTKI
jgi:putative glutamine amidotransferase